MQKIVTFLTLSAVAMPTIAGPTFNAVPEPSMLPLLGMAGLAIAITRRLKK